ncbi:MAG: acyl-CoA dehydrogenase [Gemmatimonadetes bacterium]|nr:acyl-CoA dehydrogenase [Gemmatimonadota bacterium]
MTILIAALLVVLALTLLYHKLAYWAWTTPGAIALGWWWQAGGSGDVVRFTTVAIVFAVAAIGLGVPMVRRVLVSWWILRLVKPMLPRIGNTERIALEAGTVWWDGDLFSGDPNWRKLLDFKLKDLSPRERAFLDGPVEELCAMVKEWEVVQAGDLSPETWAFIKQNGFFGMIIPEKYGGLGFSAAAHSAVVVKLASRSVTAAVTVMVPNSLGPAELILHYGTDQQKQHYLPRLARGEDIPCFALTGPEAGSDAAATQSVGIVCRQTFRGEDVLGMRLTWRKRYITLGPVATVIGLAFRLRDPDGLLGGDEDLGITCALIPADCPGIDIGKRHDPMGVPFHVGPNTGDNVFVPLEYIIGGRETAGQGWKMLMESLAAGRSISLPALSVASAQVSTRLVGAYGTVREQFDTPIGRFEGIEEPLALIGGLTYIMNAARKLTAGAVDAGQRPSVPSAIVKAYLTESMRKVVNAAMDIRAGAAICRGPRNVLAHAYQAVPIGITVEGANILTRSMIIYGQGAIRCHPFVQDEMRAAAEGDVPTFDRAFFGHIGHVASNAARSLLLGLTRGRLMRAPVGGTVKSSFGEFTRMSAAFALVSDVAMGTLGGRLKRREKITGRLADALAWMYLGSATLKQFVDQGQPTRDLPLVQYGCAHALHEIQTALVGVLDNLPNRLAALALRPVIFPLGARYRPPNDRLGGAVARGLLEDREARLALTSDIYLPPPDEPGLGKLEMALDHAVAALTVETKIRDAVRAGLLDRAAGDVLVEQALEAGIITEEERQKVMDADEVRDEVIQVDAFDPDTFPCSRPSGTGGGWGG